MLTLRKCFRADGRIELICEHGTGHTMAVPKEYAEQKEWWSHTCDGCCEIKDDEGRIKIMTQEESKAFWSKK